MQASSDLADGAFFWNTGDSNLEDYRGHSSVIDKLLDQPGQLSSE